MTLIENRVTRVLILLIVALLGMQPVVRGATTRVAELIEHEGSRGFWINAESTEAFVAIEPEFRVLSFRKTGETSLMADASVAQKGVRLAFMEPDQVPTSFDVGMQPAEVLKRSASGATVRLAPAAGLRYEVAVELAGGERPQLTLGYALQNVGDEPRVVAPWSVVAFARNGTMVVPFGTKPRARRRLVYSWWTKLPQPGLQYGRDAVTADAAAPLAGTAMKVGVINDTGWIAFARGDRALVSKVDFDANAAYPEDGANVTFFQSGDAKAPWAETEQMGALKSVRPGESTQMRETLTLLQLGPAPDAPADPDAWRSRIESAMGVAPPIK
ncbi:MAG TPA: hypothetical protein VGN72_11500 [Tepidisphaeraceae bacterium]|jgi:hypothetical protein|nr:hypothetical protein [Tepidisphaeraceae bacterium]